MSEWSLSPLYKGGPLYIEHHGYWWIICDRSGRNVAHTLSGGVCFPTEEEARATLVELTPSRLRK